VLRVLTFLLVVSMMPGVAEIAESAVHLWETGHTAHAHADPDHHPSGPEHGCSATMHLCPCHSSIPAALALSVVVGVAPGAAPSLPFERETWRGDDHRFGLYRPPIA